MNFVFISPNFPRTYWNFTQRLHRRGVYVLGIGDAPYETLSPELKASLTEYYMVPDMKDYPSMYKAVAYYAYRYGKIDFIESNNEFWLSTDAALRTDFNVRSGVDSSLISSFQSKANMKKYYAIGGIPTARQSKVDTLGNALSFIRKVGYPVIVKPEVGVGAEATYKVCDEGELRDFFASRPAVPYVMEEFITGDIYSYDAIVDSRGEPLFESSAHFPPSVMDIVNEHLDMVYYILRDVPGQLRERGRATVKAFGVKSRFVHFEFFRLDCDKGSLGKKGDFIGLEVNMRPAGGYTPDMMDFAHNCDVYDIWAEMMLHDRALPATGDKGPDHWCLYYGRRDSRDYVHGPDEIRSRYGEKIAMDERIPKALAPDMGEYMFTLHAYSEEELREMISFIGKTRG